METYTNELMDKWTWQYAQNKIEREKRSNGEFYNFWNDYSESTMSAKTETPLESYGLHKFHEKLSKIKSEDTMSTTDQYYPYQGPYTTIGKSIGELVDHKNKAYGDSFHKSEEFLRLLFPDGIKPDQYKNVLGLIRIWDKMKRIATNEDAFGENPWRDIGGYGILMSDEPPQVDGKSDTQPKT